MAKKAFERIVENHCVAVFFCAYFLYYSAYALFSSYMVSYLVYRGLSATACGVMTSLTLGANIFMQPLAGYITDTIISTRNYLLLCCGLLAFLCGVNELFGKNAVICAGLILVSAFFAYPFNQLMDAWVAGAGKTRSNLSYGRVRAGGSLGFATVSVGAGALFSAQGYGTYFWLQMVCFVALAPFLLLLPQVPLGNHKKNFADESRNLSFLQSIKAALKSKGYRACLLLFTLYWLSHRPVGSYLALICAERGGGDKLFGTVCGVGAAVECMMLVAVSGEAKRLTLRQQLFWAFALNMVRPCLLLFPGTIPIYLGQIAQSVSFSLFYIISVACFSRCALPQISSFSISTGLMLVSVVGTVGANLAGGWLFDDFGAAGNINMSLAVSTVAFVGCFFLQKSVVGEAKINAK